MYFSSTLYYRPGELSPHLAVYEKERQSFRSVLEAVNTVNMSTERYICLTRNRHMGLCVYSFTLCGAS